MKHEDADIFAYLSLFGFLATMAYSLIHLIFF